MTFIPCCLLTWVQLFNFCSVEISFTLASQKPSAFGPFYIENMISTRNITNYEGCGKPSVCYNTDGQIKSAFMEYGKKLATIFWKPVSQVPVLELMIPSPVSGAQHQQEQRILHHPDMSPPIFETIPMLPLEQQVDHHLKIWQHFSKC